MGWDHSDSSWGTLQLTEIRGYCYEIEYWIPPSRAIEYDKEYCCSNLVGFGKHNLPNDGIHYTSHLAYKSKQLVHNSNK
ncbi:hypothetical protein SLEP1_g4642 [Rubroshorea leprosula]|uniref:Uncharacterized protein n=1 Tax=Rubroshorea leprosula TaxID=152421 RepID=A0AAV5HV53_9ROSI|nr:hypothetical protein SLEP1_g4642 [Rubroshorea leprosula]